MYDPDVYNAWKMLNYHKQRLDQATEAYSSIVEAANAMKVLPDNYTKFIEVKMPTRTGQKVVTFDEDESMAIVEFILSMRARVLDEREEAFNGIDLSVIADYDTDGFPEE